jgi:hypothetical protein
MNPQSETIERRKHFIPPLMMKVAGYLFPSSK